MDLKKLINSSLLLICLPQTVFAAAYEETTAEMKLQQIAEHSYYVEGAAGTATENEGFISNAGFVIAPDGVIVFDGLGSPALAWNLREHIKSVTDKAVIAVVVSHYHADHIYGLQVFKNEGAKIIAPYGVDEYLDSPAAVNRLDERRISLYPWVNDDTRLVIPDDYIKGSQDINLGGMEFTISYLGKAHSEGDLTLFVKQDSVLFSGDIIFEGRVPFVGDADSKKWLDTLTSLNTSGLKALVPGHGPAASDPQAAIALTRNYLAKLRSVLGTAIEDLEDFETAFDEADWSEFEALPAFEEAHRKNAYQVFLAMEAESISE